MKRRRSLKRNMNLSTGWRCGVRLDMVNEHSIIQLNKRCATSLSTRSRADDATSHHKHCTAPPLRVINIRLPSMGGTTGCSKWC
ncbi:hypothetical protein J6590_018717 [Homalodisca vitripennis]|nr:hypothetical protein J6590_018717 [Homalodisca vitripennis]